MPIAVICRQRINRIHISVLWWPLIKYAEHYLVFFGESLSIIILSHLGCFKTRLVATNNLFSTIYG